MSSQLWFLIGTLATAAATLLGTRWMIRQQARQTKTTDAQQIIDQLQEIGAAAEARHLHDLADLRSDIGELRSRVTRMEDRELASFDYMYKLRAHIDQRNPPPPPEWPDVLLHRT